MIGRQEGVQVTHRVISGLPEKPAHNMLWSTWLRERDSHDLFVKVDADTVLRDAGTLRSICSLFAANPRLTGIQAPLHDYMTMSLINGLNCFSPRVTFNESRDGLFCDRGVDTGHDQVLRQGDLPEHLVPAGYHCHQASELQAFHYGVHRMLKGQRHIMDQVLRAWLIDRDRTRGLALIGGEMVRSFDATNHSYGTAELALAFEEAIRNYDTVTARIAAR